MNLVALCTYISIHTTTRLPNPNKITQDINVNLVSSAGDVITDVQIILGVQQIGTAAAKHGSGVKETIIKLLQHDLGVEVVSPGSKTETDRNYGEINSADESSDTEDNRERSVLPSQLDFPTRKPAVLQRLKITKASLHSWLHTTMDDFERQSSSNL